MLAPPCSTGTQGVLGTCSVPFEPRVNQYMLPVIMQEAEVYKSCGNHDAEAFKKNLTARK